MLTNRLLKAQRREVEVKELLEEVSSRCQLLGK